MPEEEALPIIYAFRHLAFIAVDAPEKASQLLTLRAEALALREYSPKPSDQFIALLVKFLANKVMVYPGQINSILTRQPDLIFRGLTFEDLTGYSLLIQDLEKKGM